MMKRLSFKWTLIFDVIRTTSGWPFTGTFFRFLQHFVVAKDKFTMTVESSGSCSGFRVPVCWIRVPVFFVVHHKFLLHHFIGGSLESP